MKKQDKIYLSIFVILIVFAATLFAFIKRNEKAQKLIAHGLSEPSISMIDELEIKKKPVSDVIREDSLIETESDTEKRIIVPYTGELPPEPSEEEAKYGFPDINNNKVRDDIEIAIVNEFEDDAMLVEAFFSDARTREYGFYLVKNNLLDDMHIQKNARHVGHRVVCERIAYEALYQHENRWDAGNMQDMIFSRYNNTKEKQKMVREIEIATHGYVIPAGMNLSYADCNHFFKSTEELPIE